MKKIRNVLISLCAALLFVFGGTGGAHAASQVWCSGVTCGDLTDNFCSGAHHWCKGDTTTLDGHTIANGSYKYCIPWTGSYIVKVNGDALDSSGIVCFTSQAECNALATETVPWVWDTSNHLAYMHPKSGYFFSCSSTSEYRTNSSSTSQDLYACAPGYYQSNSSKKLVIDSDSTSYGSAGCSPCAAGKYSRGRTYSCATCPSNSTCTGTGNYNFSCNSGYYGTESAAYGTTPSGTCKACPPADSGWTRTSTAGSTTYRGCYEYQTPAGCSSGTLKRDASSASAYSSTVQTSSPLVPAPGYFLHGGATYCQRCPEQDGRYGTSTSDAIDVIDCFMPSSFVLTDTSGSYSFTDACNYCTNTCSTQSECRSLGYDTCSNGCCSGYCASGVFGISQTTCAIQGYPTYTASNHCCSGSCGTETACSTASNCRSAGYSNLATCTFGCCSEFQKM